ncbi:extracellular solute-binding protein [Clostridium grantii]|uniref:Putative aldouronate transport system substrate-binding protein n=1 Tax=Clostridium grantii DSM 8605 TaxID=1121316 RepID=A0A1M5Y0H9_9CLOT|nr:extracellular solute-binding protein [Clostridium grantii]SHI05476.1 putative aldouronate transport system substrate-binding protein [Clostridium grantii DSM 8605]
MNKKVLSLVLATSILSSILLGGCGTKNATSNQSKDGEQEKQLEGSLISEEPVQLTIFGLYNNLTFDSEWPVFKEAAKNTNVSLKGILSKSSSDEATAYNLMIASGDMPDIVSYKSVSDLEKLGRDGGLIVLNDLIDEYAPNLKAYMEKNPKFKKEALALDGNIYAIPKYFDVEPAEGYFIRKDWLDKLGLEVPQTIEELYTVLKAFKEKDPNGNGKADEVPYFDRVQAGNIFDFFYLWDSSNDFIPRDGKINYGPLEPEFKVAIENLRKWYDEGLIDAEIFTRGLGSRDTLLADNVGGFTHDWFGSTASYNEKLPDTIPGFEFIPMAPPENLNGERKEYTIRPKSGGGWGITSSCKDPVTAIKYFDYWFSEEGDTLINFGVEGIDYELVDGKPVYTDHVMKSDKTPLDVLRSDGVQYRIGTVQNFEYEKGWSNPIAIKGMEMYSENDYIIREPLAGGALTLKYDDEDEKEYKKISSNVKAYTNEMIQKWILGSSNIEDDYDGFVKRLKELDIDKATEINQKAYDKYMK